MFIWHPRFTTRIDGSPEFVFDLIADLPNYGRWLPGSEAFGGTTQVSPYSARVRSNSESFSTFSSIPAAEVPTQLFVDTAIKRQAPFEELVVGKDRIFPSSPI